MVSELQCTHRKVDVGNRGVDQMLTLTHALPTRQARDVPK